MTWVSLSSRKYSLRKNMSNLELRDIQISRTLRQTHRQSTYDQQILNIDKKYELDKAKKKYDMAIGNQPELGSPEREDWLIEYRMATEEYEAEKNDIANTFDEALARLEEENSDKEATLGQEQTYVESQFEAVKAEFDAISEAISADIEKSAVKFK